MEANVFIIGSKGLPARYGGFETFVDNLTKRKVKSNIHYFVSGISNKTDEFDYNNSHCFNIGIKKDKSYNRVFAVSKALTWVENYLKKNSTNAKNIVYILGCRPGLIIRKHKKALHKLNCLIVFNPDGLEWKRSKWNSLAKVIIKLSEKRMVKSSNYLICDSKGIRDYILEKYKKIDKDNVFFIPYGSDIKKSESSEKELMEYLDKFGVAKKEYYLIVGRFVPENNYELILKEFLSSSTSKKLLIITNVDNNGFFKKMRDELRFKNDKRIIFAGVLYDEELLKKVRENAFAYIHGHSVGGTNPSLLESLSSTSINILYDVSFNKEVGEDQCLYFNENNSHLSSIITDLDEKGETNFCPQRIIENRYSWDDIINEYETLFIKLVSN